MKLGVVLIIDCASACPKGQECKTSITVEHEDWRSSGAVEVESFPAAPWRSSGANNESFPAAPWRSSANNESFLAAPWRSRNSEPPKHVSRGSPPHMS